jgi:hypothetical protein
MGACTRRLLLGLGVIAVSAAASHTAAQAITVIPRPRAVPAVRAAEQIQVRAIRGDTTAAVRSGIIRSEINRARRWIASWQILRDENDAALFWANDTTAILPGATLAPGSNEASIYTELASVLSGGWRFAVGTTLSVSTSGEDEEAAPENSDAAAQEEETDTETNFRRFTAGGGNLSLSGILPVALQNGSYSSHMVFFVPRAWANIPGLSDTENVDNFGGEIAGEYQYHRYAREINADGTLGPRAATPFLTLQVHGGLVHGTKPFYRSIGREEGEIFPYLAPTLSIVMQEKVKLGVTYFWGFGAFREHESLRINFSLIAPREPEEQAATSDADGDPSS